MFLEPENPEAGRLAMTNLKRQEDPNVLNYLLNRFRGTGPEHRWK
jgi:hypothetical protein